MTPTPRLTAQGLRDLNYYGPKRVKPVAEAAPDTSETKSDADIQAVVEAPVEPAPSPIAAT